MYGDKIGLVPDQRSQKERHGKRDEKSRAQRLFRLCLVGRRKAGNSRLDGTGAQRKSDIVNGKDHLINAEPFRSDQAGEYDTVQKSQAPFRDGERGNNGRSGVNFVFHTSIVRGVRKNYYDIFIEMRAYIDSDVKE